MSPPAAIHGLIGPNGAGKTTTFNLISGFYAPTTGRILYAGRDVAGARTSALAQRGLIRTFQGTTLFHEFTVLDNVRVGCHRSARAGFFSRITGSDRDHRTRGRPQGARSLRVLRPRRRSRDEPAASLPHGHQRALGMAVALAADPKLLAARRAVHRHEPGGDAAHDGAMSASFATSAA